MLVPTGRCAVVDVALRAETGEAFWRSAAEVLDNTGLTGLGEKFPWLLTGDAAPSSPVSCPLLSLA